MKFNYETNRILYHNIPCVLLLEPGIPDCRFLWCSPNVKFSWCKERCERRFISPYYVCISICMMSRFYGRDTIINTSEWVQSVQDEYSFVLQQFYCDFWSLSLSIHLIMWQFLSWVLHLDDLPSLNTITTERKQTLLPTQILFLNFLKFPLFCPPPVSAENQT
jgi:hypothetical protein